MGSVTPAVAMILGACGAAWGVIAIGKSLGHPDLAGPVLGGMIGPLAAVVATWIVTVRTHRRDPAALTGVMVKAFLAKVLFFAVYVVAMIKVAALPARSFGLSFVAFFMALYAVEAVLFARLSRGSLLGSR